MITRGGASEPSVHFKWRVRGFEVKDGDFLEIENELVPRNCHGDKHDDNMNK